MKFNRQEYSQSSKRAAGRRSTVFTGMLCCVLFLTLTPKLSSLGYSELSGTRYYGIHTVSISTRTLSMHFVGDPDASSISVVGEELPTRYRVESERDGGVLRVRVIGDDSPTGVPDRGTVSLTVPPHFRIDADSSHGDISMTGVSSGPVRLRSGTGSVRVSDSAGDTVLETESGELLLENVSGSTVLTAGQGKIVVRGYEGELTAHTTLGVQQYSDVRGVLSLSTNSGDILLDNVEAEFRLTSTHGAIIAEDVLLVNSSEIRSLSGDITVLLSNPSTELLLDLQAGATGRLMVNGSEVDSLPLPGSGDAAELLDFRVYVGSGVLDLYTDGLVP